MKQKHHDYHLVPYPKLRRTMAVAERSLMKEDPLLAGEVERAATWALGIYQQYEAQAAHLTAH
jgi:hypothetical protein